MLLHVGSHFRPTNGYKMSGLRWILETFIIVCCFCGGFEEFSRESLQVSSCCRFLYPSWNLLRRLSLEYFIIVKTSLLFKKFEDSRSCPLGRIKLASTALLVGKQFLKKIINVKTISPFFSSLLKTSKNNKNSWKRNKMQNWLKTWILHFFSAAHRGNYTHFMFVRSLLIKIFA